MGDGKEEAINPGEEERKVTGRCGSGCGSGSSGVGGVEVVGETG